MIEKNHTAEQICRYKECWLGIFPPQVSQVLLDGDLCGLFHQTDEQNFL